MWRGLSSHSWLLQPQDELSVRISSGRVKKGPGHQDLREWYENVLGVNMLGVRKRFSQHETVPQVSQERNRQF